MESIKVLIADDDPGMRLIESKMIAMAEGCDLAGQAQNGEQLLTLVESLHPQIVFLDIEMPGKTGIECAHMIQEFDPSIVLIFATAHDTYMKQAFEVYAFDYLVKPFKVDRVMQTLARARESILRRSEERALPVPKREKKAEGRLMLRHRDGVSFVAMQDILLIQRQDRTTVIYTVDNGRYVTSDSLSETQARLDSDVFFRCHKSYIINLNRIAAITPYGRWTYIVRLQGTDHDALITHEKYEELEKLFS